MKRIDIGVSCRFVKRHVNFKERTLTGLNASIARCRLGGRPKKLTDAQLIMMKKMHADKDNSIQEIYDMFKISRPTLFRLVRV